MKFIILCGIFCVIFFEFTLAAQDCSDPNAEYSPCGGQCELTCDNYHNPPFCPVCAPGHAGCRCKQGYVLSGNGWCILPQCCQCGENEEFRQEGPACQTTCQNLYESVICTAQTVSGCFCIDGFVRDSQGKCISVEKCFSDRCGPNEFRDCGSACDTTCATLGIPCPIINVVCNNMCYCQPGFARDDCGRCIPIGECPVNCGCGGDVNAKNVTCPSPCPATCGSYAENHSTDPGRCLALCRRFGCQCLPGLVRLQSQPINYCVRPQDCNVCTGPNEHWSNDADCTCKDIESCVSKTATSDFGCRCFDGFVRDYNGVCIAAGLCPTCGPFEEYTNCGTACPLTCQNINNPPELCIDLCVEGCFCKGDLIRDLVSGRCIPRDECC